MEKYDEKDYFKVWTEDTFVNFHKDKNKFVDEVLKFFFHKEKHPGDFSQSGDDEYVYYRETDGTYYCIKNDEKFNYDGALKNFGEFLKYYSDKPDFKHLYDSLNLKCLQDLNSSNVSEDKSKGKSKRKNKSKSRSKSRSNSGSDSSNSTSIDQKDIKEILNSPNISGSQNNTTVNKSNKKNTNKSHNTANNSHNDITTNIITHNNIFKSDQSLTFEYIPYFFVRREVEYDPSHPEVFRKKLQNVIRGNNYDTNYSVYTVTGDKTIDESHFDIYSYYEKGDNTPKSLGDYIRKEREHFLDKLSATRLDEDKKLIKKIIENFDKELIWVEGVIEKLWPLCLHHINRKPQKYIMDVSKFREELKKLHNSDLATGLSEIIDHPARTSFSTKLADYLDLKSKRYYIKRVDGKFSVDSNKHPLMYKK